MNDMKEYDFGKPQSYSRENLTCLNFLLAEKIIFLEINKIITVILNKTMSIKTSHYSNKGKHARFKVKRVP